MKRSGSYSQRTLFSLLLHLRHRSHSEGGYIIVVVAGMIVAMSAMLLTGELVSRVDNNSTKSSGNSAAGFYAAEAGLNLRAKSIKEKFQGYNVPTGTSPLTTAPNQPCKNANDGAGDFACDNSLTIQDYLYPNDTTKRIPVSSYVIDQNNIINGVAQPTSVTIAAGEPFAGLNAQEFRYDVASSAYDRVTGQPNAFLGIRFKSRLVPLFQFAVFYEQDLNFSNPPNMTMNGPLHTNSNMYLNSAGSNTLTINGTVSMAGQLFRGERDDTTCNGTVRIFSPIPAPGGFQNLACGGTGRRQYVQADVTPTWGPNQIKVPIPRLTLPATNTFTADNTGDYWRKAQLRLVLKLNNSEVPTGIEVQTASGTVDVAATNNLLGSACAPNTTTLSGSEAVAERALGTTGTAAANTANFPVSSALQLEPAATVNYVNNTAIDNDANVVTATGSTLTIRKQLGGAPPSPATYPAGTVVRRATAWTSNTFWNYREKTGVGAGRTDAKQIRMLNVDVRGLLTCANQLMGGKEINDTENGGLVWYLTVKGPNSNNDVTTGGTPNTYGIRLYNGATLASTNVGAPEIQGLTIVSDQAVYIQGDYNCGTSALCNDGDPNNDIKQPAAILADTINVLSNNWPLDDSNSRRYTADGQQTGLFTFVYSFETPNNPIGGALYYERPATNTAINAAFLAGIDLTGGGVNNYPRFHEDWFNPNNNARATLRYRGSMVSLGLPKRVNGPFCGSGTSANTANCNIYTPPTRNWDYDTDFNNAANLPPLTPRFVYLRQERFSRDYTRTSFLPPSLPFGSFLPINLFATLPTVMGGQFRF